MHLIHSDQYAAPCVVLLPTDVVEPTAGTAITADTAITVDTVIEYCRSVGAVRNLDGEEFVVQLRDEVGPELWTAESLRTSLRPGPRAWTPTDPSPRPEVFTGYTPDPDRIDPARWPNVLIIEPGEDEDAAGRFMPVVRVETNYKPSGRVGDTYPVNLTPEVAIKAAASLLYTAGDVIARSTDAGVGRMPALSLVSLLLDLQGAQEALDETREGLLGDLDAGLNEAADAADKAAADAADDRELDEQARTTTTSTTEGTDDVAE